MDTKAAALHGFLSGFGMDAYASTAVPDDASFPYLTYSAEMNGWEQGESSATVNIWMETWSEKVINDKAEEVFEAVGYDGKLLRCQDGMVWVKRGTPFSQPVATEKDTVKRRYINLSIEYLTID